MPAQGASNGCMKPCPVRATMCHAHAGTSGLQGMRCRGFAAQGATSMMATRDRYQTRQSLTDILSPALREGRSAASPVSRTFFDGSCTCRPRMLCGVQPCHC